jgi:NADH-quinone oxidoreductase subunit M
MSAITIPVLAAIPTVGAVVVAVAGRAKDELAKRMGIGFSLLTFVAAIIMAFGFHANGPRYQMTTTVSWIPEFGVHLAFGVDGIALVLIGLTAFLMPIVLLASWHDTDGATGSVSGFVALMLITETLLIGVFGALDVFVFYVLFEAMLIPMYFLIGRYGGPRRSYAAVKFLLYSLFGGLLMLAAVIGLYVVAGRSGVHTFLITDLVGMHLQTSPAVQDLLFLGFFIAFAIKAPLWPFHTWLPDAAAEAPTGAAVMLVGVLDKVGTFGFLRYCIQLFPQASNHFAPWIMGLSVVGIFYGALLAVGQRDLKRLVAYTSVAHFGFITLGIFAFTRDGGIGATFYMVNHGFSTGALFLVVGFMAARRGSRGIDDFGGLARRTPWLAGALLIAGLSSLSLPGMSTFISEFLVLLGTFTRNVAFGGVATVGIVFAAVYVLWMVQRTTTGPATEVTEGMPDLSRREWWVIAPVLIAIIAFGFYPRPILDVVSPSVSSTLTAAHQSDPRPTDAAAIGGNK